MSKTTTAKSEKIEGAIKSADGERRLTKAIDRYARKHNEYARTIRQNTVLHAAAVREWNVWCSWVEQAAAAIAQGQSEAAFLAHCHSDNRAVAAKAYRSAAMVA
jgi:hypothetical protein